MRGREPRRRSCSFAGRSWPTRAARRAGPCRSRSTTAAGRCASSSARRCRPPTTTSRGGSWVQVTGVLGQETTGAEPTLGYRVWPRDAAGGARPGGCDRPVRRLVAGRRLRSRCALRRTGSASGGVGLARRDRRRVARRPARRSHARERRLGGARRRRAAVGRRAPRRDRRGLRRPARRAPPNRVSRRSRSSSAAWSRPIRTRGSASRS